MYKFTAEEKADAKKLIRDLYDRFYMNSITRVIEQRTAEPRRPAPSAPVVDGPKVSYTDVKTFVAGSNWNGSSPRALAAMFVDTYNLPAQASRIRQYVQRVVWELKKKLASKHQTTS